MNSPFRNIPKNQWTDKRDELIEDHPLTLEDIRRLVLLSFESLLKTRIGDPEKDIQVFRDIELSSQVQGDFLEAIMSRELELDDSSWRHGSEAQKDFIYNPEPYYSTELKTSGQKGVTKVFGNRSYAQKVKEENAKKSKTGYYITVNFYRDLVYLIRFGWIDFDDWTGQSAASGQAATLSDEAYEHKLKNINGDYMLDAPVSVLDGVAEGTAELIRESLDMEETITVREFIQEYENSMKDLPSRVKRAYKSAKDYRDSIPE